MAYGVSLLTDDKYSNDDNIVETLTPHQGSASQNKLPVILASHFFAQHFVFTPLNPVVSI